jgi:hypothetical protein
MQMKTKNNNKQRTRNFDERKRLQIQVLNSQVILFINNNIEVYLRRRFTKP